MLALEPQLSGGRQGGVRKKGCNNRVRANEIWGIDELQQLSALSNGTLTGTGTLMARYAHVPFGGNGVRTAAHELHHVRKPSSPGRV